MTVSTPNAERSLEVGGKPDVAPVFGWVDFRSAKSGLSEWVPAERTPVEALAGPIEETAQQVRSAISSPVDRSVTADTAADLRPPTGLRDYPVEHMHCAYTLGLGAPSAGN